MNLFQTNNYILRTLWFEIKHLHLNTHTYTHATHTYIIILYAIRLISLYFVGVAGVYLSFCVCARTSTRYSHEILLSTCRNRLMLDFHFIEMWNSLAPFWLWCDFYNFALIAILEICRLYLVTGAKEEKKFYRYFLKPEVQGSGLADSEWHLREIPDTYQIVSLNYHLFIYLLIYCRVFS